MSMQNTVIVLELARDIEGNIVKIHSAGGLEVDLPSVVLIPAYVRRNDGIRYSRFSCYQRDDYTCQYCGDRDSHLTIDHVRPRSDLKVSGDDEGSLWRNRVTCCDRCNGQKANRSLEEMATEKTWNGKLFRLIRNPGPPDRAGVSRFLRFVSANNLEWLNYIPDWRRIAIRVGKSWLIRSYEERFGGIIRDTVDEREREGSFIGVSEEKEQRSILGGTSGFKNVKAKRRNVASIRSGRNQGSRRRG
jgi:hypothetical protein